MGEIHTYRYVSVSKFSPAELGSTLENSSWKAIAYHAYIGDLSDYFNIGDTKTLTLHHPTNSGLYNAIVDQTLTMALADFDHDNNTGTVDFILHGKCINDRLGSMNYGRPSPSDSTMCGYSCSNMRAYLNGPVFDSLPVTCSDYIIEKDVLSFVQYNNKMCHTKDKVWMLTVKETGLTSSDLYPLESAASISAYPLFTDNTSRNGYLYRDGTTAIKWWLASPSKNSTYKGFLLMYEGGHAVTYYYSSNSDISVRFGFRL